MTCCGSKVPRIGILYVHLPDPLESSFPVIMENRLMSESVPTTFVNRFAGCTPNLPFEDQKNAKMWSLASQDRLDSAPVAVSQYQPNHLQLRYKAGVRNRSISAPISSRLLPPLMHFRRARSDLCQDLTMLTCRSRIQFNVGRGRARSLRIPCVDKQASY